MDIDYDAIIEMARSVRATDQDFMKAWEVLGQYYPGWDLDAQTVTDVTQLFLDQPMPESTKMLINLLRRKTNDF